MVRKVVVEIELEEGTNLEDMLRGVKHRVLREGLWDEVQKVRRDIEKLGGPSNCEEFKQLGEELLREE